MCGNTVAPNWRQGLSPRKRQIMEAISHGLARKEIAARLGISPETIKQHTQELYQMAGVHSGKELLAQIMEFRWPQPFAGLLAIMTRGDLHQAVLAKAGELLPGACVRLIAMQDLAEPVRQAVSRGECWVAHETSGEVLYAPCWLPPDYAALAVRAAAVPNGDLIEQIQLLGMVAQARAAWLPSADSAAPTQQLNLPLAQFGVSGPPPPAPPAHRCQSPAARPR